VTMISRLMLNLRDPCLQHPHWAMTAATLSAQSDTPWVSTVIQPNPATSTSMAQGDPDADKVDGGQSLILGVACKDLYSMLTVSLLRQILASR
jgi:hypothetical protein